MACRFVLPCFISRFLLLDPFGLPPARAVAATVDAVQPLMVVFISAALLGSPEAAIDGGHGSYLPELRAWRCWC